MYVFYRSTKHGGNGGNRWEQAPMKAPPMTKLSPSTRYDLANLQSARIIAADRDRYPTGSLVQQWAVRILERLDTKRPAIQNDLFAA